MANLMPPVLWAQQGAGFLAPGNSGLIQAPGINGIVLHSTLLTLTGGTTPSFQVFIDEQDSFGNWLNGIFTLTAQTAVGAAETDFHGSFPGNMRVRWAVTGAPTGLTAAVTLWGVP